MAEYIPLYAPGEAITLPASATVTGGQLLIISGSNTVAPSSAATHSWIGVAGFDGLTGDQITIYCEGVQKMTASGSITAGANVEAAAAGAVASHTNGTNDQNIVGLALNTVTNGQTVFVSVIR